MNTKTHDSWSTDPAARLLRLEVSPGKSLYLKFDHLLSVESDHTGNDQCLHLHFATHDVTIRGHTLRRLETALHRLELAHVASVPAPYRAAVPEGQPVVREIAVTELATSEVGRRGD